MKQIIKTEFWIPTPLEKVWEFHADAANLLLITPALFKLRIDNLPAKYEAGVSFNITSENNFLKAFLNWKVEYSDWLEENDYKRFVDIQKSGPFTEWQHTHEFKRGVQTLSLEDKNFKAKEPGTWICDTVEFSLRKELQLFNKVAQKALYALFTYRKKQLEKIFEVNAFA